MRIGTATFAAALALGIAAAGCGDNKCNDQTPPISGVPSCTVPPGGTVTVPLHVCPKCDQGASTCTVDMANIGSNVIELVPLSPVCEPNSSCPVPDAQSCPFATTNCTFATPPEGHYTIVVIDQNGQQVPNRTLDVVASATPLCDNFTRN